MRLSFTRGRVLQSLGRLEQAQEEYLCVMRCEHDPPSETHPPSSLPTSARLSCLTLT